MSLTRQLKPLGVSTWKQPMPFANRIRNRYLLPGYYPFKPLFLTWRLGNQAGDLFVQRFININFKLILDYRESGKPADTNRLFSWSAAIPEKKINQPWLTLTHILPEHLYQQKDYRGQEDHPYTRKAYQYGLARLINSIPAYTAGSDTTKSIPLWPRRLNSSGRNVSLYNIPQSKPERGHQLITEALIRKELWEQFEKELSGGYRQDTIKSGNNRASSIKSNLPGENLSIKHRRYRLGLTSKADGEIGRPSSASVRRSSAMIIMRKLALPKGAYSPAIPGRTEVPNQSWVGPGSINRGNRNIYVIDSNSLQTGKQQLKPELLGQQTPGRWQGRFYSRKPGPFNLLQLPIRTYITRGTSDRFKYWREGYPIGNYARTGDHILSATTNRFYYNYPRVKYIRFLDRVLPGVNQRNTGRSLYNVPKSEPERDRHPITEVLARKELWEQFEKELSGGYRQETIKSGNNRASSIKSNLPGENLSIKHRRYRLGLTSKADGEIGRPSSTSVLRSSAVIIMRKPVLLKGAYSPAMSGRTDGEKGRPSWAGALRSSAMIIMRKPVLPKGAYSPAMPGRTGVPDQGWVRPGSINRGNRNIYIIDSNSLQTGKQQLKRELLGQMPGAWQGRFFSRKPGPFNLLQFPIRTDITNKSGNNRARSIKSNLPGENLSIKHRRYRLGLTLKADGKIGRPSSASVLRSTAMTIMRKPVLPKGAYSPATPGRTEVPNQVWIRPSSTNRGNRNMYVIDSNSLRIGKQQVKRELPGQQTPGGWQGQFFSRKPGPFNLLQLPLRTDITPGTLDSLKYRLEGYPIGSYARTGDHILPATTSRFYYNHPGLKDIRFVDRVLPGVNQRNTGHSLYNLPKLKPERGRQLVTEVSARKELWEQFKKELSGGYRQGTINRTAVKDNQDDYKQGLLHTAITEKGFSENVVVLPAGKRILGLMGSDILRSTSNQKPNRLAMLFERWLNHSLYQSSISKIQSQAAILDNKKGPQAGLTRSTREANHSLTRADKMPHTSMIPYAGNKTRNDKQFQSHVSVPDLNYRRDTSPGKYSQSNFDAQIGTINEQKIQMTASRNSDLKANEIRIIADRVYREIEQRMKQERQRRGL